MFAVLLQSADSIKFLSGLNTVMFTATILAISQHNTRVLGLFFSAHAQKRLFCFRTKI